MAHIYYQRPATGERQITDCNPRESKKLQSEDGLQRTSRYKKSSGGVRGSRPILSNEDDRELKPRRMDDGDHEGNVGERSQRLRFVL